MQRQHQHLHSRSSQIYVLEEPPGFVRKDTVDRALTTSSFILQHRNIENQNQLVADACVLHHHTLRPLGGLVVAVVVVVVVVVVVQTVC